MMPNMEEMIFCSECDFIEKEHPRWIMGMEFPFCKVTGKPILYPRKPKVSCAALDRKNGNGYNGNGNGGGNGDGRH
ncbi:MAG: hypothetical protein L6275_01915 [Candidatus Portnoybacteria bacterium]|nr:hypothetical protein [Candidatus Portnoybacteria bacterium]